MYIKYMWRVCICGRYCGCYFQKQIRGHYAGVSTELAESLFLN